MKLPPYVKAKRGRYYFQRRVPADVANSPQFQNLPDVIERALGTADRNEMLERVAHWNRWFDRRVADARSGLPMEAEAETPPSAPSSPRRQRELDLRWGQYLAREHHRSVIAPLGRREAARWGEAPEKAHYEDWLDNDLVDLNSRADALRRKDPASVRSTALRLLESHGFISPPNLDGLHLKDKIRALRAKRPVEQTEQYRKFVDALIEVELDALQGIHHELAGNVAPYVSESNIVKSDPPHPEAPHKFSIRSLAESVIDGSSDTSPEWHQRIRTAVEVFLDLGHPDDVREVRPSDFSDLIKQLLKCPANKTQRFPGMTWREAIAANEAKGLPRLSPYTVRDAYLTPLRRVFNQAEKDGLIPKNPASRAQVSGTKKKGKRSVAFTIPELNKMLALPQFVGCEPGRPIKPGPHLLDDHWFWGPLISLFTGARTSEIAQLHVDDVILEGATPYFQIQTDADRRVKTENAIRDIPIHPTLLKIGLAEYVARIRAKGFTRLFPDWEPPESGKYADAPSQRHFRRNVVPRISTKTSPRPKFHSFRNTMKVQMNRVGMHIQHQRAILGHEQEENDQSYLGEIDVDTLGAAMNQVTFDGLRIDHLYGTRR